MDKPRSFENFDRVEKAKLPSNKSFGFVFSAFFLLLSLMAWRKQSHHLDLWVGLCALALIITLFYPRLLKPFNLVWNKFGLLLHKITTPIIMGLMFYLVFFPLGIFLQQLKKLSLKKGFDPELKSYWIARPALSPEPRSMKNSF